MRLFFYSIFWLLANFCFMPALLGQNASQAADGDSSAATTARVPLQVSLNTYVEASEVPLNRIVNFNIELSWVGDLSRLKIRQVPQPELTNLLPQGSGSTNRLESQSDGSFRSYKTITYQLKPVDLGMAYINGVEIKYYDTVTAEEDIVFSKRIAVKIGDPLPSGEAFFPSWIYILLLVIFAVTVAYFLVQYLRMRNKNDGDASPTTSPAEQYLKRIASEIDPKSTNLAASVGQLSRIFREYIEADFDIPVNESSDAVVAAKLAEAGLPEEHLQKMSKLFEKLEVIKFAGGNVDPNDFQMIYGTVEHFLWYRQKQWDENRQAKEV